ncbi:MAG: DMT family transporter [Casimicrobium sp.]
MSSTDPQGIAPSHTTHVAAADSAKGLTLGFLGVLIFAATLPMTKIAMSGGVLSSWFAWSGRTVLGAAAGIVFLLIKGYGLPPRAAWLPIAGATFGIVFGWPLLNTIALETTQASHAAVVNGILPLATAIIGASLNRERLSRAFWICALIGTTIVCAYAWSRTDGSLHRADVLLLVGVVLGGFGYACGAIATKYLSGPEVITWALILGLPGTLAISLYTMPTQPALASASAWAAFAYLGLMSQWIGFFFWYRGLALGGIAKVSQVQLVQLFLTLTFSAILLGETIDGAMFAVALATVAVIWVGRKVATRK